MTMIPVSSRAMRAVGYDGHTLSVEFNNGDIYDHPGVPDSVYESLMNARSKGSYYSRHIRGKYK